MEKRLKLFIDLCRTEDFRNRTELLNGIDSGEIGLEDRSDRTVPAQRLLDIYERRVRHLTKFNAEHSRRLLDDVREFVVNLNNNRDDQVSSMGFTSQPNTNYVVFIGTKSSKILGCIRTKDKRFTLTEEWTSLWDRSTNHD